MVTEADRDRDGAIGEQELVDFLAPAPAAFEGPAAAAFEGPPGAAMQAQAASGRQRR